MQPLPSIILFLALVFWSVNDDIRARQGARSEDIDAVEQTTFGSPMILEMPFPSATLRGSSQDVAVRGYIGRFSCDGVHMPSLILRGPAKGEPGNTLHLRYVLHVTKGQDKLVSVRFCVLSSGAKIFEATAKKIKVEEEEATKFRELSGALEGGYPDDGAAVLQVTIAAKNK